MLLYAGVVGPANNPLYLASLAPTLPGVAAPGSAGAGGAGLTSGGLLEDATLRYHAVLHCALDVVDERLAAPRCVGGREAGGPLSSAGNLEGRGGGLAPP